MKIDIWNNIFDKYDILENIKNHGKFEITSREINKFREARLMTKFDNASQLPDIFSKNKLSILPTTRGSYVIAPMKIFQELPKIEHDDSISYFNFPEHIQSLSPENLSSETLALNAAYISGILEDFIQDEKLLPTINGKMSSLAFNFQIKNSVTKQDLSVNVNKALIEIDAAYEGIETLSIIEAKNHLSDDFVIRQLYYPYRRLLTSGIVKKIKTIFMAYTNNIFYLYEYEFNDMKNYNSLVLTKFKKYSFEKLNIDIDDIEHIIDTTSLEKEPEISFPQADSFERVINLCELLDKKDLSKNDITQVYGFDKRQTDYYLSALKYLQLIEENHKKFSLSGIGKSIMRKSPRQRQLSFVKQILKRPVFNETLREQLKTGNITPKTKIIEIMKKNNLYNVESESTFHRRASTVNSWVDWITSLTQNF